MAFKNNQDEEQIVADINMTPLIDIMLVLLIIFMVSSSAAIESGLDVDLPQMNAVSDKNSETLIVSLSKNGSLAVQGETVTMEELKDKISSKLISLKTDSVILEGDAESQLEKVMTIMDTARSAGAKNFSIAARLKSN